MGVEYGYQFVDETADATVKQLTTPHKINKIELNPSRSKFIIIGKRCEIFNWMSDHGNVEVKYNQEFDFTLTGNPIMVPLILFELLVDDGNDGDNDADLHNNFNCHNGSVFKKIFHKNRVHSSSTRMRLEVRSCSQSDDQDKQNNQNFVKRQKAKNGITLQQLLKVWTESENDRKSSDYE